MASRWPAPCPSHAAAGGHGCRPSCSSADRDRSIATRPSPAFRFSASSPAPLADAGFIVLRYDKRGIGQSGGRPEAASADRLCRGSPRRGQVPRRAQGRRRETIAVVGHSEGGAVGDARRGERQPHRRAGARRARSGITGAELNAGAGQKHALDRSTLTDAEKQATVDLQKQIHEAVMTGKGWEITAARTAPAGRHSVSFRAFLTFDPAKSMPAGPPADSDRAGSARHAGGAIECRPARALARSRKKAGAGRSREDPRRQSPAGAGQRPAKSPNIARFRRSRSPRPWLDNASGCRSMPAADSRFDAGNPLLGVLLREIDACPFARWSIQVTQRVTRSAALRSDRAATPSSPAAGR